MAAGSPPSNWKNPSGVRSPAMNGRSDGSASLVMRRALFASVRANELRGRNDDLPSEVAALLRGGELILEVDAGGSGVDHGLHEFERVEGPTESGFRVRDDRDEPVDVVVPRHVLFFVFSPERVVDPPDDVGDAVRRVQAQIGIHLARAVAVGGDLPTAQVDRPEPGPDLLDRLVSGESPQGGDVVFRLQEAPEAAGPTFREGMSNPNRSTKPDDVFRPVGADDSGPPFVHLPIRFQVPGLIDHSAHGLLRFA